jgi:hypothetical protein
MDQEQEVIEQEQDETPLPEESEESGEQEPQGEQKPEAAPQDDTGEPEEEAPARPTRAQDRIRRQQTELNESRVRERALQERLDAISRTQQQQQEAQNRAYLESLEPAERNQAILQQQMVAMQQQMQRQQWEMQEQGDRANFMAQSAGNPTMAKYAARVEERLSQMRAGGQNAPRESIFYFLLGQDVARRGPAAAAKQRTASASRLKTAQGTPTRMRSDASESASDDESLESLEKRLGNMTF